MKRSPTIEAVTVATSYEAINEIKRAVADREEDDEQSDVGIQDEGVDKRDPLKIPPGGKRNALKIPPGGK